MAIVTLSSTTTLGLETIGELAQQLRVDSIRANTSAGSGHPTSSMSAADLLATLVARHLRYDWDDPKSPSNDHLIFSKGHASPLLYSVFKAVGVRLQPTRRSTAPILLLRSRLPSTLSVRSDFRATSAHACSI